MRALLKLTWVEFKLLVREPITLGFVFAYPLIVLFVLAEVFGKSHDLATFRGTVAINFYISAYLGVVAAAVGLVVIPIHLAGYHERGVLRRFRASSASPWSVFGSQVVVSVFLTILGCALLVAVAGVVYKPEFPKQLPAMLIAFLLGAVFFASLGMLLGTALRSARAAQGAGLLLFFVMAMLSGAGPPRAVMTSAMRHVSDALPLTHVIIAMQDPWIGFGFNGFETLVVLAMTILAGAVSLRLLRWE
jgi:ABC-2 type transport system permease protein